MHHCWTLTALAVSVIGCAGGPVVDPTGAAEATADAAAGAAPSPTAVGDSPPPTPDPSATPSPSEPAGPTASPTAAATPPPAWLFTRVLEPDADGRIPPQTTPPELVDRRIITTDLLPPPADDTFSSAVTAVPDDVLARSTWSADCPVTRDELRYVTVTFHGFDDRPHTGELLVHADVADDVATVFEAVYAARFPIEEMRVVSTADLEAPPTGDGNNTTAFVCRPTRGSTSWSEHAFGRGIDVNPFHNPYVRDGIVLPELATAYADRDDVRPGMLFAGDAVVEAFAGIGWGWGGAWSSHTDPMHFSATGR